MSEIIKIETAKQLTAEARDQIGRIASNEAIKIINTWIRQEANLGGESIRFSHNEIRHTVDNNIKKHYFNLDDVIAKTITQYWLAGYSGSKEKTPAGIYFKISWGEENESERSQKIGPVASGRNHSVSHRWCSDDQQAKPANP